MNNAPLIERLIRSKEYQALQQLKPEFNLFSILDDALHEPAWSRIFAGLLDSTLPHGLGASALYEWLTLVASEASPKDTKLSALLALIKKESRVRASVEFTTPAGPTFPLSLGRC